MCSSDLNIRKKVYHTCCNTKKIISRYFRKHSKYRLRGSQLEWSVGFRHFHSGNITNWAFMTAQQRMSCNLCAIHIQEIQIGPCVAVLSVREQHHNLPFEEPFELGQQHTHGIVCYFLVSFRMPIFGGSFGDLSTPGWYHRQHPIRNRAILDGCIIGTYRHWRQGAGHTGFALGLE